MLIATGPCGKEPVEFPALSALRHGSNDHRRGRAGWQKYAPPGHHLWYAFRNRIGLLDI